MFFLRLGYSVLTTSPKRKEVLIVPALYTKRPRVKEVNYSELFIVMIYNSNADQESLLTANLRHIREKRMKH